MPRQFNPLDPLGLFQERDGTQAERLVRTRADVGERGVASIRQVMGTVWPPPDPLGIFHRSNPGNPAKRRFPPLPPDPPGIITPGVPDPYRGSGATIGNPIPIEWAAEIVPLKSQARETLIGRGYSPQQIDMALHWYEEWLMGMARRMAPGNMELQKTVVVSGYSDIANRAEKWLQGIEAVFVPAGTR